MFMSPPPPMSLSEMRWEGGGVIGYGALGWGGANSQRPTTFVSAPAPGSGFHFGIV